MKWLALTVAILAAGVSPSWAQDHAAEQQVLDAGRKPGDLFQTSAKPFDLEIDFTAQNHGAMPGHFSVKWQAKDHWWSKVAVGGFEQTTIRNGEMEYTVRDFGYTPRMVQELFHLLGFDVSSSGNVATNQRDRTVDGFATTCVETQNDKFKGDKREICFDKASHELLKEDWEVGQDGKDIETYADYSDFGGTVFPRKSQLVKNGEESISVSVTSLESAAFDPALLDPPKGATERRKCDGMQEAFIIKRPQLTDNQHPLEGYFDAVVTVLKDGSVGEIEIIRSGGSLMDKAAMEALKKMRFKPAMCGADPVVSETEMSFTARHN